MSTEANNIIEQPLSHLDWLREVAELLTKPPYNWKPQQAKAYALDVDYEEYYNDGWTPEDALSEDSSYWE